MESVQNLGCFGKDCAKVGIFCKEKKKSEVVIYLEDIEFLGKTRTKQDCPENSIQNFLSDL